MVVIPVIGFHHDEKYFPDPDKFIPERFSPENKGKIHPYSFLPFGCEPQFGKINIRTTRNVTEAHFNIIALRGEKNGSSIIFIFAKNVQSIFVCLGEGSGWE